MSEINLNDVVTHTVRDAEVITVEIDDTLSISGEAADAKAVGDALALKADKTELQTAITVNGQSADAQGAIIVNSDDIKPLVISLYALYPPGISILFKSCPVIYWITP